MSPLGPDGIAKVQAVVGAEVDGVEGPETVALVKAWQLAHGLEGDGVVGPLTLAAMFPPQAYRFVQAKNLYHRPRPRVDLIVIHDMEYPKKMTAAEDVALWFAGPNAPRASCDYCVDADSIVQCSTDQQITWHTPGKRPDGHYVNDVAIGVEHAGYARQTPQQWADAYSSGMLQRSAGLVAKLCLQHDVQIVKLDDAALRANARGICGHVDCSHAYGGTHQDPGGGFPWALYISLVLAESNSLR